MNKTEENKLSMYDAVSAFLGENSAVTSTMPAFAEAEERLNNAIGNIKARSMELNEAASGVTSSKYAAENELIDAVLGVSNALYVLAKRNKDEELKSKANLNTSKLRQMRDTELQNAAKSIAEKASANQEALAAYGVTAEIVADLNSKLDAYEGSLDSQSTGFAGRSAARQALDALFDEADDIINDELDPLVEILKGNNVDFYNQYQSARVIKDLGLRHTPEEPDTAPAG